MVARGSVRSITAYLRRLQTVKQSSFPSISEKVPPRRSSPDRKGVHQNQPRSSSANTYSEQMEWSTATTEGEGEEGCKSHTKIQRAHSIDIPPPRRSTARTQKRKCDGTHHHHHHRQIEEEMLCDQKHIRCTICGPASSYWSLAIHIS